MERKKNATIFSILGVILFIISFVFILQIPELYILSLGLMFVGVVLIGIGGAILKGFDKSLDEPEEECYYCSGSGSTDTRETCPRCGGTGLARPDDE